MRRTLLVVLLTVLATTAARSAEWPLRGRRFALRLTAPGAVDRLTVRVRAKQPGLTVPLAGDPAQEGATVTLVAGGASSSQVTFQLPPGGSWQVRRARDGSGATRFVYRDRHGLAGPIRLLALARGRDGLRVSLELRGSGDDALRPPNPGTEAGLIVSVLGGDTYCVGFGAAAGGRVRVDSASRFVMGTAAQAACTALPTDASFVAFETEHVRPLALSPDGRRLFAVNTPDGRLEIFRIRDDGGLDPEASVPVGLEPVAVAARTDGEVWVVNHVSDSISIVDVGADPPRVVRTLLTCDEPRDLVFAPPTGGRAFVTTARRGQNCIGPDGTPIDPRFTTSGTPRALVQVFDPDALGSTLGGTPSAVVELFGDTPRALAVSPAGDVVYAAVFRSGNRTATVHEELVCDGGAHAGGCFVGDDEMPGGLPLPNPVDCRGNPQPETGLIVGFDPATGAWTDATGRDWRAAMRFSLPDLDVFAIDATATPPVQRGAAWSGVGTVLFDMAVNPRTGVVYVTNTDANNRTRFEGDRTGSCDTSTVRGRLHEARITVLDDRGATPRHLNEHLVPYDVAPSPEAAARSLATPVGVVTDGTTLWVAALGSSAVGIVDVAALESGAFEPNAADHIAVTGGGPTGMVLRGTRLYVATRFDNGISILDVAGRVERDHVRLHDREPSSVRAGRRFLYDAAATSANGEASCAACHVFGDADGLAWDLGDPDGESVADRNPFEVPPDVPPTFAPMKGPMVTQSLRGMANHGPLHWRGDRTGAALQGGDAKDEHAAFMAFNPAFVSLLGRDTPLPPSDMRAFADFALQIVPPPSPVRNLDGSLTPAQARGRRLFFDDVTDGLRSCAGCHAVNPSLGFFGTDGDAFDPGVQAFKIPHLRGLYQKIGMFGLPAVPSDRPGDNGHLGDQVRGFGFLHDGGTDTIFRFVTSRVFTLSTVQARDVEEFVLAFDANLAPIVGQQATLTATTAAAARVDLFVRRAASPFAECDLVVKGVLDGAPRGWLRAADGSFRSDRAGDAPIADVALRAQAATPGQERTYTCAPPGSGRRLAIDRDEDGCLDGDDPAPADPAIGCTVGP